MTRSIKREGTDIMLIFFFFFSENSGNFYENFFENFRKFFENLSKSINL